MLKRLGYISIEITIAIIVTIRPVIPNWLALSTTKTRRNILAVRGTIANTPPTKIPKYPISNVFNFIIASFGYGCFLIPATRFGSRNGG